VQDIAEKVDKLISKKKKLRKNNPRVVIRCMRLEGASKKDTLKLCNEKPDAIIFTPVTNWAGLVGPVHADKEYHTCLLPWLEMAMLHNGDFALCCNDPRGDFIVGRFLHESITQIWQGERLNQARMAIAKKPLAFVSGQNCQNCTRLRKGFSLKEYFYFLKEG